MKAIKILSLLGWAFLTALSVQAQKKVPHSFQYQAKASEEGFLKDLTQISYPGTSSIRLYFEQVELGPESYLLLKGSDGAQQKMDAQALKNWRNSSAYFNGQNVKISLYQAKGEAASLTINQIKVNDRATKKNSQSLLTASASAREQDITETFPWAAAVGRFTDGVEAYGTGWIAANGAVVTTYDYSVNTTIEVGSPLFTTYDIIEFNVPPSNPDGTVNHPSPEDQYPLNLNNYWYYIIEGNATDNQGAGFEDQWLYQVYKLNEIDGNDKELGVGGVTIIEALPNGTGQRPGERIGEYFQVTRHPTGATMQAISTPLTAFYYSIELVDKTTSLTLHKRNGIALNPHDWLSRLNEKDRFIIFDKIDPIFRNGWEGAPIVYAASNVAVGVLTHGTTREYHNVGTGFRNDFLLQKLGNFFSTDVTYVDQESHWPSDNTGSIHRPFLTIGEGVQQAATHDILNIARGAYNESITINKPLTLSAPVGIVKIGTSEGMNARSMQPSLPSGLFAEDFGDAFAEEEDMLVKQSTLKSFPNPFVYRTELHYTLTDESPVQVKVFDIMGKEVHTLLQEEQTEGQHSVQWDGRNYLGQIMPTGLYIMQLKTGEATCSVRVMKQ